MFILESSAILIFENGWVLGALPLEMATTEQLHSKLSIRRRTPECPPNGAERSSKAWIVRLQRQQNEEGEAEKEEDGLPDQMSRNDGDECRRRGKERQRTPGRRWVTPEDEVLDLFVKVGHISAGDHRGRAVGNDEALVDFQHVKSAPPSQSLRETICLNTSSHSRTYLLVEVRGRRREEAKLENVVDDDAVVGR